MMNREDLDKDLLKQAEGLDHRVEGPLDGVSRRTEMLIRRIFGESSPYLQSLQNIGYRPMYSPAGESTKDEMWRSGQQSLINLIGTMLEEVRVFESTPIPVLAINDDELRNRTSDILSAPANYDRALREATTILEDRIRGKVPDLSKLIPKTSDMTGENLINKLLSPKDPVLVCRDRHRQGPLFRMFGGVVAYLRNPSHHSVDDNVKWSWAWSVVGLVDQLLDELESTSYSGVPTP